MLREVARGRERHADDAALRRRVGDLPDLPVVRRHRRGADVHAALTVDRLVLDHRLRGREQQVERPEEVDLDRLAERAGVVRPPLGEDAPTTPIPAQATL